MIHRPNIPKIRAIQALQDTEGDVDNWTLNLNKERHPKDRYTHDKRTEK
jgi:hypothetical protein